MNWADEPWVKLYRRNTADWLAVGWEARAVYHELLKHVNRRGQIVLGRSGLRGLAVVLQMPQDVVERSIPILAEDGALVASSTELVLVNFVEAQETRQSDAARKRAQREREKDHPDDESQNVTSPNGSADRSSRNVTESHAESHGVTPCHEQIRREEKRREEIYEAPPPACAPVVPSVRVTVVDGVGLVGPQGTPIVVMGRALDPPPWSLDTVETVAISTGIRVEHVPTCWAQFVAHLTAEGRSITPAEWQRWLTREARNQLKDAARERARPQRNNRPALQQSATKAYEESDESDLLEAAKRGAEKRVAGSAAR